MTEIDRFRVARVFATDPEFDIRLSGAAALYGEFHEFAYAALVDAGERVLIVDFFALVFVIEQAHVVAA